VNTSIVAVFVPISGKLMRAPWLRPIQLRCIYLRDRLGPVQQRQILEQPVRERGDAQHPLP
jgi:hypothetical protein